MIHSPARPTPHPDLPSQRHRVCVTHYRADSFAMEADGAPWRFCQQVQRRGAAAFPAPLARRCWLPQATRRMQSAPPCRLPCRSAPSRSRWGCSMGRGAAAGTAW